APEGVPVPAPELATPQAAAEPPVTQSALRAMPALLEKPAAAPQFAKAVPVMIAAQPFQAYDDNPCRPRHFKPPPCAPVIPEGPARKALEACHARLFFTGILFACVFGIVALRVVEVVLLEGGTAQSHMPRFRIPAPPAPARADIVDRNGRLLATTLDSPSVYANPKQILDPADATR